MNSPYQNQRKIRLCSLMPVAALLVLNLSSAMAFAADPVVPAKAWGEARLVDERVKVKAFVDAMLDPSAPLPLPPKDAEKEGAQNATSLSSSAPSSDAHTEN